MDVEPTEDEARRVTATQDQAQERPKTASESAERRYATVNPFTGETEQAFDYTPTEEVDGIIGRAHAAYWFISERAGFGMVTYAATPENDARFAATLDAIDEVGGLAEAI